jgi:hypothetical protein
MLVAFTVPTFFLFFVCTERKTVIGTGVQKDFKKRLGQ